VLTLPLFQRGKTIPISILYPMAKQEAMSREVRSHSTHRTKDRLIVLGVNVSRDYLLTVILISCCGTCDWILSIAQPHWAV
jgi:hypothetical protein